MLAARPSIAASSSNPLYPAPPSLSTYQSRPSISSTRSDTETPTTPSSASQSVITPITKEWTLQPRPKPGRKPAQDIPPTKRKAQNREAQRAFRERRAQRVGELEEKNQQDQDFFKHREEQWKHKEGQWRSLEAALSKNGNEWRGYAEHLQQQVNHWKTQAQQLQRQLDEALVGNQHLSHQLQHTNWARSQEAELPRLPSMSSLLSEVEEARVADSCKTCDISKGNCACLNEFISDGPSEVKHEDSPMEIDFTTGGKNAANPITIGQATNELIGQDGCGFCKNPGPECPCTDDAGLEVEDQLPSISLSPVTTRTMTASQIRLVPAPPIPTGNNEAPRNGPGSCAACLIDPDRRRFCQTMGGLMAPPPRPGATAANDTDDENEMDFTSSFTSKAPPAATTSLRDTPMTDLLKNRIVDPDLIAIVAAKAEAGERITCADTFSLYKQWDPMQINREEYLQSLKVQAPRMSSISALSQQQLQAQPQTKICGSSGRACDSGCTADSSSTRQLGTATQNPSRQQSQQERQQTQASGDDSVPSTGISCFTCKDTGCAPMEVDAASVLVAMQQGRMFDYKAKMRMRSSGSEEMDGSE
jgi:hypothetical protein